jgi:hypothetical protein
LGRSARRSGGADLTVGGGDACGRGVVSGGGEDVAVAAGEVVTCGVGVLRRIGAAASWAETLSYASIAKTALKPSLAKLFIMGETPGGLRES